MIELIVRGGTLVTPAGTIVADLAVEGGRTVAIGEQVVGPATAEIDARGLHVVPGVIDAHVHFDEPGRTEWEGIATGSRAFASGGGTTYFDMPLNASPPTVDGPSFDLKLAAAEASSVTDFALWGGLVPGNLDRMDELAERGVIGFKAFMSRTGTPDFPPADDFTLYKGMHQAARLGLIVAVHAENDTLTAGLAAQAIAAGRRTMRDYLASRPAVTELEAIGRAIRLAEATGCPLHIVHVSTGAGVTLVVEAQARGVDVSCETCAHYLALTDDDVLAIGAAAKCAPPIRDAAERDALWAHVAAGTLSIVTSDHSPTLPALKAGDDAFAVWGGIAGCQSTLAVLLTEGWERRGLPLPLIANLISTHVARRFRLPGKGGLEIGHDADLALVDVASEAILQADDLRYRHRSSPYIGRRLRGHVRQTLVRGVPVIVDGAVVRAAGGRLVRPAPVKPEAR